MSKALNQNEIDVLLQVGAMVADSADAGIDLEALEAQIKASAGVKAAPYNFKRPRLFSQDQMRVLQYVHESFARDLSVFLSAQLRTMVEISMTAVDQVLYAEYVASSAPPSALYVADVDPFQHQVIFELDPRFVVYTVEKLFGGQGVFLEAPREVSHIERRIMGKVVRQAFTELDKAWSQAAEVTFREAAFESNAEFVQILPSMEPALVGTFEVRLQGFHSFVNICYPYLLLEKMLGRSGMQQWMSGTVQEVPPEARTRYEDALRTMEIELRAVLGQTTLSLSDVAGLQVGDVIPRQRQVDEPIPVFVDQHDKFTAAAGHAGRHRAFRILEPAAGPDAPSDHEPR
ncbi:MAG: flagellar motor switch protein FliM [Rhodothermales bacterium]|nr:flagellar motor switch protein FliM [Rhodothermales bacterium]